ncbi:MAG TPA: PEGA domain-containing protein [Bryobacteraceae bacterium]|nr:PEGA domain-containing protein [Bryobacteraceae bacterium]
MRRVAGGFLLAAAAFAQGSFDLSGTVRQTLADWQKNTGIGIETEAESRIRHDVGEAWPRLEELVRLQAPYEASPEPLTRMLVRTYCFDLRDALLRQARPFARARQARTLAFQAPASGLRLRDADVLHFSFLDFLSGFFPRLQPVGYLQVTSKPDRADITIDNQPKGFTNRVFVVSPGSHTVAIESPKIVRRCRRTVQVAPGRQISLHCP